MPIGYSARAAPRICSGGQCIRRWGVNTVKTLNFEKGGGACPTSSYGGAALAIVKLPTLKISYSNV